MVYTSDNINVFHIFSNCHPFEHCFIYENSNIDRQRPTD